MPNDDQKDNNESKSQSEEESKSEQETSDSVTLADSDSKSVEDEEHSEPSQPSEFSEPEKKEVKVSASLQKIIEQIEKLSVLELSDLVHALEDRFGVSAAPTMMAGVAAATASSEPAEEQTTFNVVLTDGGANKISVIKAVREIVPTLGLTDAKALVDTAPKPVLEGVGKEAANEAKTKLEAAGAKVELQ